MGMDTEEMYRRGVADAAQGEPHPFYYQHYYQYRKGYDRARRSRGLPGGYVDASRRRVQLLAAALVLALALGAFFVWRARARPATTDLASTPLPILAAVTSLPTRTPIFAT